MNNQTNSNLDYRGNCDWQAELRSNITTVDALEGYLQLSEAERSDLEQIATAHPMNIPRYYLELIDPADPEDPKFFLVNVSQSLT